MPFWANLIQKIKVVSLNSNFLSGQFEYAEFNGNNVHFYCSRPEISFLGKSGSKNEIDQFKLKFEPKVSRICRIQ